MAYLQYGEKGGYYGAAGDTATDYYEYKHQETGYISGEQYRPPPHHHHALHTHHHTHHHPHHHPHHPQHHHSSNYSGEGGWVETDMVTKYHTQQQTPMPVYAYSNSAAADYYSHGHAIKGQGQGLIGKLFGGGKTHHSHHTRRRRVRKVYPTGEYYSCSETDSSEND